MCRDDIKKHMSHAMCLFCKASCVFKVLTVWIHVVIAPLLCHPVYRPCQQRTRAVSSLNNRFLQKAVIMFFTVIVPNSIRNKNIEKEVE